MRRPRRASVWGPLGKRKDANDRRRPKHGLKRRQARAPEARTPSTKGRRVACRHGWCSRFQAWLAPQILVALWRTPSMPPDAELRHLAHEVAHALAAVGPVTARLVRRPVPAAVEVVPQRRRPHLRQPDDERQRPARGPLRRPPPLPRARPDQENDQADDAPQGRDHRRKGLKTYIILRAAAPTITEVKVSF